MRTAFLGIGNRKSGKVTSRIVYVAIYCRYKYLFITALKIKALLYNCCFYDYFTRNYSLYLISLIVQNVDFITNDLHAMTQRYDHGNNSLLKYKNDFKFL